MPHTLNEPTLGMVYASGTGADAWKWAAVKARELNEEDQEQFKTTHKSDMTTITLFSERDYMDALSYIGVLPE